MVKDLANITRCTQAVLRAFDIEGYPTTGSGVLEYLKAHGYKVNKEYTSTTLGSTIINYLQPEHDYIIFTPGHVIGVKGQKVIDTANCGPRTRVKHVWRVSK